MEPLFPHTDIPQEAKLLQAAQLGGFSVVKTVHTSLGPFGEQHDLIFVERGNEGHAHSTTFLLLDERVAQSKDLQLTEG